MPANNIVERTTLDIKESIENFASGAFASDAIRPLNTLGYQSDKVTDLDANTAEGCLGSAGIGVSQTWS